MNLKKIESNRILELRCEGEVLQRDLALALKANMASVSAWENNHHQPSPRYAVRIQKHFGLPYAEIFTFST